MVASSSQGQSPWVSFSSNSVGSGFDSKNKRSKSRSRRGDASQASWMNKPINGDASWVPVLPPGTDAHATSSKHRPPRQSRDPGLDGSAGRHRRVRSGLSTPGVSSDSSTSSGDHRSRGRSSERRGLPVVSSAHGKFAEVTLLGRRGRSGSRRRTRSSSRTRERSASVSRRTAATRPAPTTVAGMGVGVKPTSSSGRGRSRSRPPPTSANNTSRGRSTSSTRMASNVTRTRSASRTRGAGHRPPPSTSRTRREMRVGVSSSNSVGPGVPPGRPGHSSGRSFSGDDNASLRSADANIGRDISFGKAKGSGSRPTTPQGGSSSKRSGFMEKLFGDQVSADARQSYLPRGEPSPTASASSLASWQQADKIHSRILLTATVYHNTATNLWIATINTNQKGVAKNPATASKYLKAFSFASEKEARESAIANAPPKMLSFDDHPNCHICKGKFAMFRRAGHCRNCGVCVCNSCSTTWPSKMLPETYNLKKESQLKVCKSCNHLSSSFKKALTDGDYEEAVALYGTGNINLRTPFPTACKKDDVVYPIHCAVEGGNIDIVRWLMEDHFCPIKVIRTGSGKKPKRGGSADTPILTSKGRSVLTIAMSGLHVDILRFLVINCGVSIYESKDLKSALRALEAVLLALPVEQGGERGEVTIPRWDDRSYDADGMSIASSLGADQTLHDETSTLDSKRRSADQCIICYENSIDCVMTPCGHQVCCLECSTNLSSCPVCNVRGEFIKIFRP